MEEMNNLEYEREEVVAINIDQGIIWLIDPDGEVQTYKQRGIDKIDRERRYKLMELGYIHRSHGAVEELPSHWDVVFEDEEIMGVASGDFEITKEMEDELAKYFGKEE